MSNCIDYGCPNCPGELIYCDEYGVYVCPDCGCEVETSDSRDAYREYVQGEVEAMRSEVRI